MPNKGDITDWVEAYPNLSTNESISKLNKAIAIAVEADELQRIEKEEKEKLVSLLNGSVLRVLIN